MKPPAPERLVAVHCPICESPRRRVRYTGLRIAGTPTELVICRVCGTGYITPRAVGDDLERQYVDPDYLRYHYEELYLPIVPAVVEFTRKTVKVIEAFTDRGTLLDFGCGVGPLAAAARDAGWETLGFDVSPIAIEKGRELLGTTVVGDWQTVLDSALAPFDVVAVIEVVEHVERPHEVLRLALAALRPGGILVVSTPNLNSVMRLVKGRKWGPILPDTHIMYLTPTSLRRLISESGAAPLRVYTWGNEVGRLPFRRAILPRIPDPPGGPALLAVARKPL